MDPRCGRYRKIWESGYRRIVEQNYVAIVRENYRYFQANFLVSFYFVPMGQVMLYHTARRRKSSLRQRTGHALFLGQLTPNGTASQMRGYFAGKPVKIEYVRQRLRDLEPLPDELLRFRDTLQPVAQLLEERNPYSSSHLKKRPSEGAFRLNQLN